MMRRLTCILLGHSRSPMTDRVEIQKPDANGYARCLCYCGCCGQLANSFSLVRRISLGEELPRGYGMAWRRWASPHAVVLPVPLNVIAAALRSAWVWLKCPRGLYDTRSAAFDAGRKYERTSTRKEHP